MKMSRLPQPVYRDSPAAPVIFSEGAAGFYIAHGNIHVTMTIQHANHDPAAPPSPGCRVVVARLVLPVAGAQALAVQLYDFLKQRGLDPVVRPASPSQVQ